MSNVIHLKRCLDIKLVGRADLNVTPLPMAEEYAVRPTDFRGLTPKMLVREGDRVKAGTPLFFDKRNPELLFTSPVSGTVKSIVRGEKRRILKVAVTPDETVEFEQFEPVNVENATAEQIKCSLLQSGLWPLIVQRPFGVIADPAEQPKNIHVSLFDTAPLAPDMEMIIARNRADFERGIKALSKLTAGKVWLGANETTSQDTLKVAGGNIAVQQFRGAHPTGCVGIQINHICPINKGDKVWTVDAQGVILIGRFLGSGRVDMKKTIALVGSEIQNPTNYEIITGADLRSILMGRGREQLQRMRIINGNVLSGLRANCDDNLGFFNNMITVIPEGDKYAFLGWITPRFDRFSVSRMMFSWLCPKKVYDLDTNLNGGKRPFVMSQEYEKVVPMDIYPVYLLKSVLAKDIDKMENLGIYEILEEDLALCEFVCTSKIDVQQIVSDGIEYMMKELN